SENPMKVLILCGGYGARLAGVGADVPKPMVPVGGRPMAWHIMKGFAHWGFDDFVLCLGYRSDLFRQYSLNLSMMVDYVTLDLSQMLEREPLQRLATDGQLVAYQHEGFWFCVDTPRDYHQLQDMWNGGKAPWAVWQGAAV